VAEVASVVTVEPATIDDRGVTSLKAFTQPVNTTSIAFHRSLGFLVSEVPGYVGPGELRVVFTRELAD
jgi:hypothetical protein